MEAGAALLLLSALLAFGSTEDFYGDSISFMPPHVETDGTFEVTFHHRQNGRSDCENQEPYIWKDGMHTSFITTIGIQTDEDDTGQGRWCQTEGHTTATGLINETSFSVSDSGCCWVSNVNGKTNWTTHAELDVGTRSDTHALNNCPVTTTVSSLRAPQNCFSGFQLLAHDPEGDHVKCHFTSEASVSSNFTLNETTCTLTSTGEVAVGVHVFEIMLEDYPTETINLTYRNGTSEIWDASDSAAASLCKLTLQFSLDILSPVPDCDPGHVLPMFLPATPLHGSVLSAFVGQTFHLSAEAQAHHASINDFQISGPKSMTKEFVDEEHGKAKVTLSWTPEDSDLHRAVPVCFTADTNETQSDMRCVVVTVSEASILQGKVRIRCLASKMVVAIEKASIPDVDENFLRLKDRSCPLTSNSTHIIGKIPFSTCGTKLEDKGGFITFKNVISSFNLPAEVINRRRTVNIDVSCQFPKSISISSTYKVKDSDYIFTESSFGSFGYSFDIFTDGNFTSKVEPSAYPVEIKMLDTIYMGIEAESELPNVKLFVESCIATPDDNPDNSIFYDLIKNGCLQDETLKVHTTDDASFNFEVQSFKFSGDYDQVYITCSVILCEPESPFSRCAQGCLTDAARRRKRSLSRETTSRQIIQGPFQFPKQDVHLASVENTFNYVVLDSDTSIVG